MRSVELTVAILALVAVSCSCSPINSNYISEFNKLKEEMGDDIYNDGQRLLEKVVAWRNDISEKKDYVSIVKELIFQRPINKEDVPYLLDELNSRASTDPDFHTDKAKETERRHIVKLVRRYIVDSCKHYEFTFKDLFSQMETEDPALGSYSSADSVSFDLYKGWAAYELCKNLVLQFYNADLLEDLLKVSSKSI